MISHNPKGMEKGNGSLEEGDFSSLRFRNWTSKNTPRLSFILSVFIELMLILKLSPLWNLWAWAFGSKGLLNSTASPESVPLPFCLGAEKTAVSLWLSCWCRASQAFFFLNLWDDKSLYLRATRSLFTRYTNLVCVRQSVWIKNIQQLSPFSFKCYMKMCNVKSSKRFTQRVPDSVIDWSELELRFPIMHYKCTSALTGQWCE